MPAVGCIQRTNQEDGITGKHYRHNLWNFATYLLGFPMVVFLVVDSFGLVTSTEVIAGKDLRESELKFLAKNGLLDPDEKVQYFYTLGVFLTSRTMVNSSQTVTWPATHATTANCQSAGSAMRKSTASPRTGHRMLSKTQS